MDGKYIVVGGQEATSGKNETGINEATLSGKPDARTNAVFTRPSAI